MFSGSCIFIHDVAAAWFGGVDMSRKQFRAAYAHHQPLASGASSDEKPPNGHALVHSVCVQSLEVCYDGWRVAIVNQVDITACNRGHPHQVPSLNIQPGLFSERAA